MSSSNLSRFVFSTLVAVLVVAIRYNVSSLYQFKMLFWRSLFNYARDIWGLPFRILIAVLGGTFISTGFVNLDDSQGDVSLKYGLLVSITMLCVYDHVCMFFCWRV